MPPKRSAPNTAQPKQPSQNNPQKTKKPANARDEQPIPEHEVKQSSSMSATMALEATKKAYELRQAAYGAGDPNAREEILAKAINKEIEAESFGKAAKYTRSGAFQGLAAGAGIGVQPGVTLGKLTGALVGGVAASVGALVGGGVGSAYGAISGPMWDLGGIASQGVRSIIGDFPNWEATSSQKQALEKMVMGAQKTKAPNQQELEEMKEDDGGVGEMDYQQFAQDCYAWLPSMPSMPSMPSLPGFGGQSKASAPTKKPAAAPSQTQKTQSKPSSSKTNSANTPHSNISQQQKTPAKPQATSNPQNGVYKATPQASKTQQATTEESLKTSDTPVKKKPKKLEVRSTNTASQPDQPATKRRPPKLAPRQKPATASA